MKRIIETTDDGFEALLGKSIQLWCMVYIYTGKLVGVNDDHLELEDAAVVFETGELRAKEWKDAQPVDGLLRVMRRFIESWGPGK